MEITAHDDDDDGDAVEEYKHSRVQKTGDIFILEIQIYRMVKDLFV